MRHHHCTSSRWALQVFYALHNAACYYFSVKMFILSMPNYCFSDARAIGPPWSFRSNSQVTLKWKVKDITRKTALLKRDHVESMSGKLEADRKDLHWTDFHSDIYISTNIQIFTVTIQLTCTLLWCFFKIVHHSVEQLCLLNYVNNFGSAFCISTAIMVVTLKSFI